MSLTFIFFLILHYSFRQVKGHREQKDDACPNKSEMLPCTCSQTNYDIRLWCTHSELSKVIERVKYLSGYFGNGNSTIDQFILQDNNLPSLPGRTFHNLQIMRLMLRNNNLHRVSSGWLSSVHNLLEIHIAEPELKSLPEDSLSNLNSLQAITIKSARLKHLPKFVSLPKLRYVSIESISLIELDSRTFKTLTSLESVHVIGSPYLTRLDAKLFADLTQLSLINITFCSLNWLHPRFLFNLPKLKELSLVGNKLTNAGIIGGASREAPNLQILRLDFNQIEKLVETDFVDLPNLKELSLDNNKIFEIQYRSIHSLPQLQKININDNLITQIHPKSFLLDSVNDLLELNLARNKLSNILDVQKLLDNQPKLKMLDLSYNQIKAILFESIRGHFRLEKLYLNHNEIEFIEKEAFIAMSSLIELSIKNNSLSNHLDAPLWNLPLLKGLDLSLNYYTRLEPIIFKNLPSLRILNLSGNVLQTIDPATFLDTPKLETINLSYNELTVLHPATFRHLMNLYELDLSRNRLIEFVPGLPRNLVNLFLKNNRISQLPTQTSPDLDFPSLKNLDLSNNHIEYLTKRSFQSLGQLEKLSINRNYLQHLNGHSFEGLRNIKNLDLSDNNIVSININSLSELIKLEHLNLFGNKIEKLNSKTFATNHYLRKIDLSSNQLVYLSPELFKNNYILEQLIISDNLIQHLPQIIKHVETLNLTNNNIGYINGSLIRNNFIDVRYLLLSNNVIKLIPKSTFENLSNLELIDLSNNGLEDIESNAFSNLQNLEMLFLDRNRLKFLPQSAFSYLPNLHTIRLENNHLNVISNDAFIDLHNVLFLNFSSNNLASLSTSGLHNLQSLAILDISSNKLRVLNGSFVRHLKWLIELKIDNNYVCSIVEDPFTDMIRLRYLSLRNNMLNRFDENIFRTLRNNIAVFDVDGNPLDCSCDLLWLKNWLNGVQKIGPHCSDGTLVRNAPIAHLTCIHYEAYNYDENQNNCSENNDNHLKQLPVPQDSGYFYDEFIDFNTNNPTKLDENQSLADVKTQKPHLSTNRFSFFGMPISSLTFSNFFHQNTLSKNRTKIGRKLNNSLGNLSVAIVDDGSVMTTTDSYFENMGHPIKEPDDTTNNVLGETTTELNKPNETSDEDLSTETVTLSISEIDSQTISVTNDEKKAEKKDFRKSTITRVQSPYKEQYNDFFQNEPKNEINENDDLVTANSLRTHFFETNIRKNDREHLQKVDNQWYYLNYNSTNSPFIMFSTATQNYLKFKQNFLFIILFIFQFLV